jgi:hypothetical protein
VQRLRAERPDAGFTISLRIGCTAENVAELRSKFAGYAEAGVQHVLVAPEDRDVETYLATVEKVWRCGEGL